MTCFFLHTPCILPVTSEEVTENNDKRNPEKEIDARLHVVTNELALAEKPPISTGN